MRSLLFVPADDEKRIERVHERGADVIILDLEDGVAPAAKPKAREILPASAAAVAARGARVFVRVNAEWRDDLVAAASAPVAGLVVPKVHTAKAARAFVDAVRAVRTDIQIIALIESAIGLSNIWEIAMVEGVTGLALGGEDLCVELGVAPNSDSLDLPCKLVALAAATRGLFALGAPISIGEFKALDDYRSAVSYARRIGLTGALCIHPAQVALANEAFAPSAAEVEDARQIMAAWEGRGDRGVVSLDGRMIDLPVVARAARVLGLSSGTD